MNTHQLEVVLMQDSKTGPVFGGVYPCNRLPRIINGKHQLFIANTDPAHKPGQHWVAFYFHHNGKCTYFDSYGLPPMKDAFVKFMDNNSTAWVYNTKLLQHHNSTLCGEYCIFFAAHICRGVSLTKIQLMFNADTFVNDLVVRNFIYRHYNFNEEESSEMTQQYCQHFKAY